MVRGWDDILHIVLPAGRASSAQQPFEGCAKLTRRRRSKPLPEYWGLEWRRKFAPTSINLSISGHALVGLLDLHANLLCVERPLLILTRKKSPAEAGPVLGRTLLKRVQRYVRNRLARFVVDADANALVQQIRYGLQHFTGCPLPKVRQVFLLKPDFFRRGIEAGQISEVV